MSAMVEAGKKVWTEAELQALPEQGFIREVLSGFTYPIADLFADWDWG